MRLEKEGANEVYGRKQSGVTVFANVCVSATKVAEQVSSLRPKKDVKKRRPYKTIYSKGFCRFNKPIEPFKSTENQKTEKMCFILRSTA